MAYKIIDQHTVLRLADRAFIPNSTDNADWLKYLKWLEAGNTPEPADPLPTPIDQGDLDQIALQLKAVALMAGRWNGKTVAQIKADFRQAMKDVKP